MAPQYDDDDWSDSDEEPGSDVETSVQLGVPDGPLESAEDRLDAAVSRIGGHPVRYHSFLRACTLILIQCHIFHLPASPSTHLVSIYVCANPGIYAEPLHV